MSDEHLPPLGSHAMLGSIADATGRVRDTGVNVTSTHLGQPVLDDLQTLRMDAIRAKHLASDVLLADPEATALDTWCWMEAGDFDFAPVSGTGEARWVGRDDLARAQPESTVESVSTGVDEAVFIAPEVGLRAVLEKLGTRPVLLVRSDEGRVTDVLTTTDLMRPAVSLYVFGLTLAYERGLRRLLASFANTPLTPYAPPRDTPDMPEIEPGTLDKLIRSVGGKTGGRLPKALGSPSNSAWQRCQKYVGKLRNDLAHGRSILHRDSAVPVKTAEEALGEVSDLEDMVDRIWGLVHNRSQVWDAFQQTVFRDEDGDAWTPPAVPGHILTACNPFEQVQSEVENARRNRALLKRLEHTSEGVRPLVAGSQGGGWEERSFWIPGLSRAEACRIGRHFGQRAIFETEGDAVRVVRVEDGTDMT